MNPFMQTLCLEGQQANRSKNESSSIQLKNMFIMYNKGTYSKGNKYYMWQTA